MDTEKITENPAPAQGGSRVELADLEPYAPLPWRAKFPRQSSGYWYVEDAKGSEVAVCYSGFHGADVRAKYIARAVNCHDELVAALRTYGSHVHGPVLCEKAKHSDYPCTCGLDALLAKFVAAASRVEG